MQHWQVFEDCRAAVRFGGAWLNSDCHFVDCHFLRCHSAGSCGGLSSANGASVEMIRGSIMGCSGTSAAGVYIYGLSTLRLLDVTIAECRATADGGDGGGIYVSADASVLTMSAGRFAIARPKVLVAGSGSVPLRRRTCLA